jgi:hypothetical protein
LVEIGLKAKKTKEKKKKEEEEEEKKKLEGEGGANRAEISLVEKRIYGSNLSPAAPG